VVSFTPRPLYLQGKSPLHPFDRRLGGPQETLYGTTKRMTKGQQADDLANSNVLNLNLSFLILCHNFHGDRNEIFAYK
jgi:hypothetical protein